MPIYKNNNNSSGNLNLDSYHEKILSELEDNEKLLQKYSNLIEKMKQDLDTETSIDKKLDIKDRIQYYKNKIKQIKKAKKEYIRV